MEDLALLFNLLKGSGNLYSSRTITTEAREATSKVQAALSFQQAHQTQPDLSFNMIILGKSPKFHALIFQWGAEQKDCLLIIELIFLSHQPSKSVTQPQELMARFILKARARLCTLTGCNFSCIHAISI